MLSVWPASSFLNGNLHLSTVRNAVVILRHRPISIDKTWQPGLRYPEFISRLRGFRRPPLQFGQILVATPRCQIVLGGVFHREGVLRLGFFRRRHGWEATAAAFIAKDTCRSFSFASALAQAFAPCRGPRGANVLIESREDRHTEDHETDGLLDQLEKHVNREGNGLVGILGHGELVAQARHAGQYSHAAEHEQGGEPSLLGFGHLQVPYGNDGYDQDGNIHCHIDEAGRDK